MGRRVETPEPVWADDDLIAEAITTVFGNRCSDYAEYCPCCAAWKQYDELRARPAPVTQKDKAE